MASSSSSEDILQAFKNGELTLDQVQEKLAKLKLKELKTCTYKVSPKGAISFYGLRRMPITVYKSELDTILQMAATPEFAKFLADNAGKFATKEDAAKGG